MNDWGARASAVIAKLATTGESFDSDTVLSMLGHPDDEHEANGMNNAIGSAFSRASRQGLIEAVGVRQSKQPKRKGGMVRIWRGSIEQRLF